MPTNDEQSTAVQVLPAEQDIGIDNLVAMAQAAEKRVDAIRRIKAVALRVTNRHDWVDQNGRPYLQVSGAEKVARLFGISWRLNEPTIEMLPDGHYSYIYSGEFSMGTASIEAIGGRSSNDPFFCQRKGGKVLTADEVDRQDVRKAAYTNCIGNGVTRLLGIRNLTWEEVEQFAGFKRGDASKVEYQRQEMSQEAQDLRAEIRRMILEMSGGDAETAKQMLEGLTSFTDKQGNEVPGKRRVETLSEKQVPVTYGKIKKAYEEFQRRRSAQSEGGGADDGDAGGGDTGLF